MTRKKLSFIIFIILLGGVLLYNHNTQNVADYPEPSSEEDVVSVPTETGDAVGQGMQRENMGIIDDVVSSDVGKITLDSVDDRGGLGYATRSFENGIFTHRVLLDVDDPQDGKFYEGWLVQKPSLPVKFYSTGAMEKNEEGQYELIYEAGIDEKAYYNSVVITEETLADGLDNKPEAHIFEGQFADR